MNSRLDTALESIASAHLSWVPVLDDDRHVVATLSVSDLVQAYRRELLASAERVSALGASAGAYEVSVTKDSTLAGHAAALGWVPRRHPRDLDRPRWPRPGSDRRRRPRTRRSSLGTRPRSVRRLTRCRIGIAQCH